MREQRMPKAYEANEFFKNSECIDNVIMICAGVITEDHDEAMAESKGQRLVSRGNFTPNKC